MTASARLSDGTVVSGDAVHVQQALLIDGSMRAEEQLWIADLRSQGIKAAHPDDGWVERERSRVHLCYPHFNDGLGVGDLLALGRPERWRVVRVTGSSDLRLMTPDMPRPFYWHFTAPLALLGR